MVPETRAADVSAHCSVERLRDGPRLEVRALRPDDRAGLLETVRRSSDESLYRRFFAVKRDFTEREVDYYMNVDFVNHVALVAVLEEAGRPVIAGGGRYIVAEPGVAEVAFAVDDAHQGLGIASALLRNLVSIARASGLEAFVAEVLPDNGAMLKVFERSGLRVTSRREPGVIHVRLALS